MIWVILFGIGLLLSLRLTYLRVNLFSVNEKTFTTKWFNFWKTTSLDAKLPIVFAFFSLTWIAERLAYYRITFLTKSDEQLPYVKLTRFCYGAIETLGASLPIIFSSKLAAVTIFSRKENSTLWLGTKLWIMIVAVICITLEQLTIFNNNDAALVNNSYTSWNLFFVAWQFFICAVISLLRVKELKKCFVASKLAENQHGSEQKGGNNDTLNIIKRMERQALTFILTGAVLTLHVVLTMNLRPGAIVKPVHFCEFENVVVNLDIITFICGFLLFLYLYLNWPKNEFNKGKKVAPAKNKRKSVSSIQSINDEGNVVSTLKNTETESAADLKKTEK